ncbi:hypothetical protein XENTR_v10017037 [Xenopus tropicalis]|nr:hypothetical protein XENTR_v10017037 [Xenopus tropicalis]
MLVIIFLIFFPLDARDSKLHCKQSPRELSNNLGNKSNEKPFPILHFLLVMKANLWFYHLYICDLYWEIFS